MATLSQALLLAFDHHRAGRAVEAETLYRRILDADPEQADALQLLGVLVVQSGRADAAVGLLRRAVALRPDGAAGLSNLAGALQTLAFRNPVRAGEAEAAYRWALRIDRGLPDAWASRAAALRTLGRVEEAAESAAQALVFEPAHADALANRADALLGRRDPVAAERCVRRALAVRPTLSVAHSVLASALAGQRRWKEAEQAALAALAANRRSGEAWETLGAVLAKQGRFEEGLNAFAEAEALRPGPSLWGARANVLIAMAKPQAALVDLDRALSSRPQDAGLHWNRGFTRLLAGDYAGGWPEFDWRRHDDRAEPPWRRFEQPTWQGEPIAGRTILLYAEQGLGDTLQFLRYVPLVAARGARVVLEVQRPLLALVNGTARDRSPEGAVQIVARGDSLPPFDVECPLMSLPRVFGTTLDSVPATVPYLLPDPERLARWRQRLAGEGRSNGLPAGGLRVGLVWAGNPRFPGDAARSPRLGGLRPLLDVRGLQFFGLQMGPGRADLAGAALPKGFTDLGPDIADFADTAAIMANLDLVVSSCTGPAHLAGALGRPLWLALPFSPDWRWLLDRPDSPWYPTARLFRQPAPGDWRSLAMRMAEALEGLVSARGPELFDPQSPDTGSLSA